MEYIENITACDDVFSEYCLDDENMSIQPEQINTPGISDLDTGIDLSGISFIQSEINKTYGLKYAPVDGDGYGNDSNLLIVFYVQIMPDDLVMQLHRF